MKVPKLPTLPNFTLPSRIARLNARMPQTPPSLVLVGMLKLVLERVLPDDALQPLIDKRFLIHITDAGLSLRFGYSTYGFHPVFDTLPANLTISAKLRDFIALLAREEDPDTLFFSRRLQMEGETDLAHLMKNTLDGIDVSSFTRTNSPA